MVASRLQPLLTELIHLDQVGFVPSREARDNIIKVLTPISAVRNLLAWDAEKAFDRVNWELTWGTLEQIGLGARMFAFSCSVRKFG